MFTLDVTNGHTEIELPESTEMDFPEKKLLLNSGETVFYIPCFLYNKTLKYDFYEKLDNNIIVKLVLSMPLISINNLFKAISIINTKEKLDDKKLATLKKSIINKLVNKFEDIENNSDIKLEEKGKISKFIKSINDTKLKGTYKMDFELLLSERFGRILFWGYKIDGYNLSGSKFIQNDFSRCNFNKLHSCDFSKCNLSHAQITVAKDSVIQFNICNLQNTNFNLNATNVQVTFTKCRHDKDTLLTLLNNESVKFIEKIEIKTYINDEAIYKAVKQRNRSFENVSYKNITVKKLREEKRKYIIEIRKKQQP